MMVCVGSRRPNPHSAASSGTQNAEIHLWNNHKVCVGSRRPNPHSAASSGTQNAEIHLWNNHKVCDPSGRRKPPRKAKEKTPSRNIAEMMKLNARDAREEQIANQIIDGFDRLVFQRLGR
ncbi:hypothetical protein Forpi1262_v018109 [Fusarium oxysporum f. sp. raphani]|uniref:Uncharacterized protein n=1 Tax=Fusarium oxysporum f. sp. raphani TaxID=96318 RepID=A0A8J5NN35_FUSOX|nr:hypothetical protein Forpi1262_v018109 [Fusarium oxysporum f. sp. raphani]